MFVSALAQHACSRCLPLTDDLPALRRLLACLLQFDRQWEADAGFVHYDYRQPEALPSELAGAFDFIVVDPPFITHDVWSLYAQAVQFLAAPGARLLLSSVAENEAFLAGLLGVHRTVFQPSIPHLVYQYAFFANYVSPALSERNPEIIVDA